MWIASSVELGPGIRFVDPQPLLDPRYPFNDVGGIQPVPAQAPLFVLLLFLAENHLAVKLFNLLTQQIQDLLALLRQRYSLRARAPPSGSTRQRSHPRSAMRVSMGYNVPGLTS